MQERLHSVCDCLNPKEVSSIQIRIVPGGFDGGVKPRLSEASRAENIRAGGEADFWSFTRTCDSQSKRGPNGEYVPYGANGLHQEYLRRVPSGVR